VSNATLLEVIGARHEDLRNSEKAVADLVLADPVRAMEFNLAGLADAAGVSEPTVMRFCSAIGFDGFRSFKINLAQTLALGLPVTHSAIQPSDTSQGVTEKVFSHTISSLDRARRTLDPLAVDRAVDLLTAATEIIFVGAGASGIVAQDAQQKFPLFGVPCQAPADHHQQFIAASLSVESTVVVALSHTAGTRSTIQVARAAKNAGARVIAISGASGPLTQHADLDIRVNTFEDTDIYTPTVSRLAALVVIDILAAGVAMRRGKPWSARVRAMKDDLARMRS
jgi:RpiR family carbohydrate utilization transcriptional regulator